MKRILSIFLTILLTFALCGCSAEKEPLLPSEADEAKAPAVTEAPETPETVQDAPVSIMVLNGTTGFGMAKLVADAANGDTAQDYSVSVETDASAVTAALISGDCDIAALPTNAAATVYNKTESGVQMLAINTLGVLYVVADTEALTIDSLSDLEGMTVYAPAQNPTFIFKVLTEAAGINVTIDNSYAQPADLRTALAAGQVDIAVLPEPMVTIACSANPALSPVLDLTAEWDAAEPEGSLVQGCVAARTEFIENNPEAVKTFLTEYKASVNYLTEAPEDAAALIEQTGVFSNAAVAQKALPGCNVCCITGEAMRSAMNSFAQILFALEPAAVGGAVPGDDFYYPG